MTTPTHQIAAREMWESVQLQGEPLDRAVTRALDPGYWRALAPDLSVGESARNRPLDLPTLPPQAIDETARRFREEGYFQLPPVFPSTVTAPMLGAVDVLERADWPHVFTWIYDEFWQASRTETITGLLGAILGAEYRQTPYLWTHVVPGRRGAAGWPPHADNPTDSRRITVWIPLSDATPDTGCMSLVPRHLAPTDDDRRWYEQPTMPMREVMRLLHASRALTARAGAVLAWDTGVVHWGSPRQADGDPRVSFAMEFLPANAEPVSLVGSMPGDSRGVPAFDDRLRIVARNLVLYQRNEPRVGRYIPLAERILERLGGAAF